MKNKGTGNSIVGGLAWKFCERFLTQGVSFLISLVLARLLSPDDYGIIALVTVFITLAAVFINSGFGTALIQKKDADSTDFSTMFYCSLAASILIYLVIFFAAPLIAKFYENELLIPVLRALALQIPISSYNSIQVSYVSRHMQFRRLFLASLVSSIVSGGIGIVMALAGFGVWALVAQSIALVVVSTIVLAIMLPWHPERKFCWSSAKSMMKYGSRILAADLSGSFFTELRSLIIGRVYTKADLAYYTKGQNLPNLFTNNLSNAVMTVMFPALSNHSDDLNQVKQMTKRINRMMSYILVPVLFGLAAVMSPLILLLYTEKWAQCIPYAQVLCVSSSISVFGIIPLQILKAIGRSDVVLNLEFIKKPVYLVLLMIGVKINVFAIAVTMLLYDLYGVIINMMQLKKYVNYGMAEQIGDLFPAFALGGVMVLCVIAVPSLDSLILTLAAKVLVGAAVYVGGSALLKLESFLILKQTLLSRIRK